MLRSLASGSLPSSFSVLSNLKQLYIEDGLSGSLPAAVGRMTSLESLQINGCPLGGSLPSEMKFLAKLLTLEITSSNITGSLDPIQPLTQLQRIQIRRGRLLGSIPSGFSRFSNLNQLVLDDNALSGTVPGKWAGLTSLSILVLASNSLSGKLPVGLGALRNLMLLDLSYNSITGPIPKAFSGLKSLMELSLHNNHLTGPLPNLAAATTLNSLYVGSNFIAAALEGLRLPKGIVLLSLECNQLYGSLPASFSLLSNLQIIMASSNNLSGSLPTFFSTLPNFQLLDISNNSITGGVPYGLFASLKWFSLLAANNAMAGVLPALGHIEKFSSPRVGSTLTCPPNGTLCPKLVSPRNAFCKSLCPDFCNSCVQYGSGTSIPMPPSQSTWQDPPPAPAADPFGYAPGRSAPVSPWQGLAFRPLSLAWSAEEQGGERGQWGVQEGVDWRSAAAKGGGTVSIAQQQTQSQGECGISWAYAAVAAVESAVALASMPYLPGASKRLPLALQPAFLRPNLSERHVAACRAALPCMHWQPDAAFAFMAAAVATGKAVLARGAFQLGATPCSMPRTSANASLPQPFIRGMGFERAPEGLPRWLSLLLVLQQQPAVVNLRANHPSFRLYTTGVYSDPGCALSGLPDHSVAVVGYSLASESLAGDMPHWIVRNSWGDVWGEQGHMRIAMAGGDGICNMHATPASYPTIATLTPCLNTINPCGGGQCVAGRKPGTATCVCPPGFRAVINGDGTQTCAPADPCSFYVFNPCGFGSCVSGGSGGYTCVCFRGFQPGRRAADDSTICVPDSSSLEGIVHVVAGDTSCAAIQTAFSVPRATLLLQNPKLPHRFHHHAHSCRCESELLPRRRRAGERARPRSAACRRACGHQWRARFLRSWQQRCIEVCSRVVKKGTRVNVTQSSSSGECSSWYCTAQGESCSSLQAALSLDASSLALFNPGLDCSSPLPLPPATTVCASTGGSAPTAYPLCTRWVLSAPDDTCASLAARLALSLPLLLALNPGLLCSNLPVRTPATLPSFGEQVCVSQAPPSLACAEPNYRFEVVAGDTCTALIARRFGCVEALQNLNAGLACSDRLLHVGLTLCAPPMPLEACLALKALAA
ncbi:hypothetical protein CLOP_g13460 [Closterium sp. NIES-67]|nr:hypothetical protein CLOP_g13460 [Closterium sp. NIES-67]